MKYNSSILNKLAEARSILREDNRGHGLPINIDIRIGSLFALSQFERRFLSQILYLSKSNGVCFAGDLYFENLFSISKGAVRRKIKFFHECGLITVFRELGCRLIRVNIKAITWAVEELNSLLSDMREGNINIPEEKESIPEKGEEDMSVRSIKRQNHREKKKKEAKSENKEALSFCEKEAVQKEKYDGNKRISKEQVKEVERLLDEICSHFIVGYNK